MTECSKQIFSTDTAACPVLVIGAFGFWSLLSADASLHAEFRASNFGFIKASLWGTAVGTSIQATGSTGGFFTWGMSCQGLTSNMLRASLA